MDLLKVIQIISILLTKCCLFTSGKGSIFNSHSAEESSCATDSNDFKNFLPPDYNKLAIPTLQLNDTNQTEVQVQVGVSIMMFKIMEIDEKKEELKLDTDFSLRWLDWSILKYYANNSWRDPRTNDTLKDRVLDSQILKHIWKPDIFIDELISADFISMLTPLDSLTFFGASDQKVLSQGEIMYSARLTLTVQCEMDFKYYPADLQVCEYYIRSYSYPREKLILYWGAGFPVAIYLDDASNANYDVQIYSAFPNIFGDSDQPSWKRVRIEETFNDLRPGNYSALMFTIKVRRKLSYHLVQTYLPSILLIVMTWLCFLIPDDMVEARIGISMTAVLTLTAMFAAVRGESPAVSYTMAIDAWMIFCIFSVFVALLLFTSIYWLRQKLKRQEKKRRQKRKKSETIPEPSSSEDDENGYKIRKYRMDDPYNTVYRRLVYFTHKYAFLTFSITFLIFVTLYWGWLLSYSQYFKWNPSPIYNHVVEDSEVSGASDQYQCHKSEEYEETPGVSAPEVLALYKMDAQKLKTIKEM